MKRIITVAVMMVFLMIPINAYANSSVVEIMVNGEIKKGASIEILVNVKDMENLYAASVDFVYDTTLLKVESISATNFVTKHINDIMELGGETDKNGNTAVYSFTFLGDKNGIKGSGTLASIKATVLKDGKLSIGQDSMKVKLVKRAGDTVEEYKCTFVGYNLNNNNSDNKPLENNGQDANEVEDDKLEDSNKSEGQNTIGSSSEQDNEPNNQSENNSNTDTDNKENTSSNEANEDTDNSDKSESNNESSDNISGNSNDDKKEENVGNTNSENITKSESEVKDEIVLGAKSKKWIYVLIGCGLASTIGGIVYYFYRKRNK